MISLWQGEGKMANLCRKYEILKQRKYRMNGRILHRKCVTPRGENSIAPSSYPEIS